MAPESTGRKLGIGLRLAAKAVQRGAEYATAATTNASSTTSAQPTYKTPSAYTAPATAKAKGVAKGAKRFGEAIWGPLAHSGGVLWLEITGLFFALIALFFGQNVYRFRPSWKSGPDHTMFLLCSAITVLFIWFTFTSFRKARQKEKKNRARQLPN